jgi:hypothetical protein
MGNIGNPTPAITSKHKLIRMPSTPRDLKANLVRLSGMMTKFIGVTSQLSTKGRGLQRSAYLHAHCMSACQVTY